MPFLPSQQTRATQPFRVPLGSERDCYPGIILLADQEDGIVIVDNSDGLILAISGCVPKPEPVPEAYVYVDPVTGNLLMYDPGTAYVPF